jgi:hypothetical protein
MRIERRSAVRADDPEVFQPVIVSLAVDVVKNQAEGPAEPELTLTAQLAMPRLKPVRPEASLQRSAGVGRTTDQDLVKRTNTRTRCFRIAGVGIEVIGDDPPAVGPQTQRPPVTTGGTEAELTQGL